MSGVAGAGAPGADWSDVSGVDAVSSEGSGSQATAGSEAAAGIVGHEATRARSVDMLGLGLADQLSAALDAQKTDATSAIGPNGEGLDSLGEYEGVRAKDGKTKGYLTMEVDSYRAGGPGRVSIRASLDETKEGEVRDHGRADMLGMFPDVTIEEYQSLFEGTDDVTYDLKDAKFEKNGRGPYDYDARATSDGNTRTVTIDQRGGKGRGEDGGRLTITIEDGKVTDFQMEKWVKLRVLFIPLGKCEVVDEKITNLNKVD